MAEQKTRPGDASVAAFLDGIPDETRRDECRTVLRIMQRVTKNKPVLWGTGMFGFGRYRYTYASGHSGEWFVTGFAPRKRELTVYLMCGFDDVGHLLAKLGRHKMGKSCLYIARLAEVDLKVLEALIDASVKQLRMKYP